MADININLEALNMCTCLYHELDLAYVSLPETKTLVSAAVTSFYGVFDNTLYQTVYSYLAGERYPDPFFLEYILTPLIKVENRRRFIIHLWKRLLKAECAFLRLETEGGRYCSVHGAR